MATIKRHKGNPKPPKGVWVSPAPEKERQRENGADENTEHKGEKEGTANIWAYRDQVLKGDKPNTVPTPETKKKHQTKYPTSIPEKPNKKPNTKPTKSRRTCHCRVEGPMGRLALLGSHPRGPQYRGVQVPPHYRNRPQWCKKWTNYPTQDEYPKNFVPALSRSMIT